MKQRFPLLAAFMRGYLHQDVIPEYGSAIEAARAYRQNLSNTESTKLKTEVEHFRSEIEGLPISSVNAKVMKLGSAWNFNSHKELDEVFEQLCVD